MIRANRFFAFVFLALVAAVRLSAIEIPDLRVAPQGAVDFDREEAQVAATIARDGTQRAKNQLYALAELYLKQRRPQEAAWTLRRGGFYAEASAVERALEAHLMGAGEGAAVNKQLGGVSAKNVQRFQGGIETVVKWWREGGHPDIRLEVVAYELDKLLKLDIVPATVKRQFAQGFGSAQYFMQDSPTAGVKDWGNAGDAITKFRMAVLDALMGNTDRHSQNWLYRPGKFVVAIDHGHCTIGGRRNEQINVNQSRDGAQQLADSLAVLQRASLDRAMSPYLKANEIETLWTQLQGIKQTLANSGIAGDPQRGAAKFEQNAHAAHAPPQAPVPRPQPQAPAPMPQPRPPAAAPPERRPLMTKDQFEDIARLARRGADDAQKAEGMRQLVEALSDRDNRASLLPQIVSSKRVAHLFEELADRFPREVVLDYHDELTRFAQKEEAHNRALRRCSQMLNGGR